MDVFGLFVLPGSELMWGLILGIFPEIAVGLLLWNKKLRKSLRADIRKGLLEDVEAGILDPAIARATDAVREDVAGLRDLVEADDLEAKIQNVQARLESLDQALETRLADLSIEPIQAKIEALDAALGVHLNALHEGLQTLPARLRSSLEGKHGSEIKELYKEASEAEMELVEEYEAALTPGERALAKFDGLTETEGFRKYEEKHEIGATLVRGLKEIIKGEVEARRGVVTMRQTGSTRKFPKVYGER